MSSSITYEALGLRPVINAAATLSRLGGSRMPPPVLEAMAAGATYFVDLFELQGRVGERIAEHWLAGVADLPGVTAERGFPSEAGQPHARAVIHFGSGSALDRDAVAAALWDGNPRVAVGTIGDDAIALNPQTLEPGEEAQVLLALRRAIASPAIAVA